MANYVQVVPSSGDAQSRLVRIQKSHLTYLHLEEDSEKRKARHELEDLIAGHLSTVANREKFTCPNFLDILRRSVDDQPDFEAGKAADAFCALETYAHNVIVQPWRQEYSSVRLYSGFYKHKVEACLSNAKEVFFLMGYEQAEGMELLLNEPVDPDRVIDIALNCLIASVECQIMKQVLDKVGGYFTWKEIARTRRHNVGGVDEACILLQCGGVPKCDRSRLSAAEARCRAGRRNNGYVKVEKLIDVPGMWTDDVDMVEADERYPRAGYGSSWEQKPSVSNGQHFEPNPYLLFDDSATLSLMHQHHRRSAHLPPPLQQQLRAGDCWGQIDQPSQDAYSGRNFVAEHDNNPYLSGLGLQGLPASKRRTVPEAAGLLPSSSCGGVSCYEDVRGYPLQHKMASMSALAASELYAAMAPGRVPKLASSSSAAGAMSDRRTARAYAPSYYVPGVDDNYDDLIQLEPAMFPSPPTPSSSSAAVAQDHAYRTSVAPYSPGASHFYHPLYAHLQMAAPLHNRYSSLPVERPDHAAVPPPPQPPSSSNRGPRDLVPTFEAFKSLSLDGDVVPAPRASCMEDGGRRTKQQRPSAEERRSWYDNVLEGFPGMPPPPQGPDAPAVPPHLLLPPPSLFASDAAPTLQPGHQRRSSDGVREVRTLQQQPEQQPQQKQRIFPRDDLAVKLDVPDRPGRKSGGSASSSSTASSEPRERSARESADRSCPSSSASSSCGRLRHERSASVSSARSGGGGSRSSASNGGSGLLHRSGQQWSCWACTYLNKSSLDVCDMCSRSRLKGAESDPLSSGGHECQNCTLVNEKGAGKCAACGCNLENSPTYV